MSDDNKFNLYDFYNIYDGNIIISYKGPMDEFVIHSVGNYIKDITKEPSNSHKKLFKVYMELIQNVSFYSLVTKKYDDGKKVGSGILVLFNKNGEYYLNIGNMVNNKEIDPIIRKCETINSMDRDELREFKRQEIAKPYSSHGGGNIGLIQVALSSKNPLNYKLTPVTDNTSFFALSIKIISH